MIGDVLTSSILFKALRDIYPKAELHYLIYPHTKAVVAHNPYIDKLVFFDPKILQSPLKFLKFTSAIKKERYDVTIDVYAKIATALISKRSKAKIRISYKKQYIQFLYTHVFSLKKDPRALKTNAGFAIENRMLLLQALHKSFPVQVKPKIYLTEEEKYSAKNLLKSANLIGENVLMMGPLGSSGAKTYPLPYFAKILDYITENTDAKLLFNYTPAQKAQIKALLKHCKKETNIRIHLNIYGKSLRDFLALTSQCNAFIGNEGGQVNMAKALDIPTFAIFSPQVTKEAWSIYEGKRNYAIHVKEVVEKNKLENLSKEEKYQLFTPEKIFPKLEEFLSNINLLS